MTGSDGGNRALDALADTAVGVLGDSIDHEGTGWQGQPWLMLVVLDASGSRELLALPLEAVGTAEQLAEVAEAFRSYRPVACSYVDYLGAPARAKAGVGGTLAAVVALDGEGGERVVACRVSIADDGREMLVTLRDTPLEPPAGDFHTFLVDALALCRAIRNAEDADALERWARLGAVAGRASERDVAGTSASEAAEASAARQ